MVYNMLMNFHRKVSKLLLEYIVKDQSHKMAGARAGRTGLEGVRQHLPPPAACHGRYYTFSCTLFRHFNLGEKTLREPH